MFQATEKLDVLTTHLEILPHIKRYKIAGAGYEEVPAGDITNKVDTRELIIMNAKFRKQLRLPHA